MSTEWQLKNRTAERDALQKSVDKLHSELATARQELAESKENLQSAKNRLKVIGSDLTRIENHNKLLELGNISLIRQLAESRERERKLLDALAVYAERGNWNSLRQLPVRSRRNEPVDL